MRRIFPLVATLALSACFFEFDRFTELQPGDIAGRVVLEDGAPAAYAHVRVENNGRLYVTDEEGNFLVRGLGPGAYALRFTDDTNGDGLIERAAHRVVALNVVAHSDGLFGSESRLSFVSLGDVALQGVVEVNGRVVDEAGDPIGGANVVVVRDADLPATFLTADGTERNASTAELTVETRTSSRADGEFSLLAVAAGEFKLIAELATEGEASLLSEPRVVTANAGDVVDIEITPLELLPPPPSARDVQLELTPIPEQRVKLHLADPKTDVAPRSVFADFQSDPDSVFPGAPAISTTVPLGVHSVFVGDEDGRVATLGVHVASRPGEPLVIWGTGFLDEEDVCPEVLGGRDCDRDGAREIPPGNRVTQAILLRCTDACIDAFGSARGDATCEVSGVVYDCDDDGDGQPDMTEPAACRTLFAGGDWDHDGLCWIDDPFDDCVSNDPRDPRCGAGTEGQDPPPLAPEYDGVDFFESDFDGGPDPTDAGPGDAGQDAGPDGDAGIDDAGDDDGGDADAGPDDGGIVGVDGGADGGPGGTGGRTTLPDNGFVDIFGGNFTVVDAARAGDGFVAVLTGSSVLDLGLGCQETSPNGFVARFDSDGDCLWARTWTLSGNNTQGTNSVVLRAVAAMPDGSVAVGGVLTGSVNFAGSGGVFLSAETEDGFVVTFDDTGDTLVGTTLPSTANGGVVALGALENAPGDLFVIGSYAGTLDLAGGQDPSLASTAVGTDGYVARLGLDLTAAWLRPLDITSFAFIDDGAVTATGTTEYAIIGGQFAGTLLPGVADRTDAAGGRFVATIYDDGTVQGWASFDGLGFEPMVIAGNRARGRVLIGGNLPAGDTYTLTDADDTTESLAPASEARWVVQELTHGCVVTQSPVTLTANDGSLRLSDVAMDDRGVAFASGQMIGSITASGASPLGLDTGSTSVNRGFLVSWRPATSDPTLDDPQGSMIGDSAGDVHQVVPLPGGLVFALGDVFTDARFEGTPVASAGSPNLFSWRLSDGLARRQLVVTDDSWAKPLALQRFVEIGAVRGLGVGGFVVTGTYPVTNPTQTPPLALGGACGVLDRPKEFSFVAAFDAAGECRWVRTVETYDVADAGPSPTGITFQNGVVELPSGQIVTAMTARSAPFTFGDDEGGTEVIVDPGNEHWGVFATYTADGALVRTGAVQPFAAQSGEQVSLNSISRGPLDGFIVTGETGSVLRIDTAGGSLSTGIDSNVTTDGWVASVASDGNPSFLSFAGSVDTGSTMTPVAVEYLGGDRYVAVGYASGDVFPLTNLLTMDNLSVWVAIWNGNSVESTSAITGVYGDDLALAVTADGTRFAVATNSGFDVNLPVNVENPAGATVLTEPGSSSAMTVVALFDGANGAPLSHVTVRAADDDGNVEVPSVSFAPGTDLWVGGQAYDSVQYDDTSGSPVTLEETFEYFSFALRFRDQGSDTWAGEGFARTFFGEVRADGAAPLVDNSLLVWGQIYDDARFIGWDWFHPDATGAPYDFLWFVPTDLD